MGKKAIVFRDTIFQKEPNLFNRAKCIQSLDDLLQIDGLANDFGILTDEVIHPAMASLEVYNVRKIKALKTLLEHSIEKMKRENPRSKGIASTRVQLNVLHQILDTGKFRYFIEDGSIVRSMLYCYASEGNLGRLHSLESSMPAIDPKYYHLLFKREYINVSFFSSTQTALHSFSLTQKLNLPVLGDLVHNEEEFHRKIQAEICDYEDDIAKVISSVINSIKYLGKSQVLRNLHEEILLIREILWGKFYPIYKETFLARPNFLNRSIEKQKIRVQTMFCQTGETRMLLSLSAFLKSKITDETFLSFVPFRHGAFVKFEKFALQNEVSDFIDEFNDSKFVVQFKVQPLDQPIDSMSSLFAKHLTLNDFLRKLRGSDIIKLVSYFQEDQEVFSEKTIDSIVHGSHKTNSLIKKEHDLLDNLYKDRRNLLSKIKRQEIKYGPSGVDPQYRDHIISLEKNIEETRIRRSSLYKYWLKTNEAQEVQDQASAFYFRLQEHLLHSDSLDSLLAEIRKSSPDSS
jgi:hypothetical protein